MTVSHWRRTNSLGTIECDVAIVGAGITGIAGALAVERRGLKAVVIERRELAAGASSRNAGFLMRGAAENYAAASEQFGRENAQFLWKWTETNLAMLRAEGIEKLSTYQRVPSCLLAVENEELEQLRLSAEMLREDGFSVRWMDRGEDAAWRRGRALGGLVNPDDAACNPVELMNHLAGKLSTRMLTGQEAVEFETDKKGARLRITDGFVRARHVLFCTNAFVSAQIPRLAGLIEPNRGQMLALDAGDLRLDCSYYINHGSEYIRQPAVGTIVVGGWRKHFAAAERTTRDGVSDDVQNGLEKFAEELFGERRPVTARWSGIMGFSKDGLPIIGPVEGSGRLWYCGGYTGHGMSMAFKAAHEAVGAMLDGTEPPLSIARFG
ncbi:MAG TPA: FAD-binding oxidoreductase [Phycisphaerales bacterium]|nr:FAD-binding oxidoreductase [Phycisphaerales bacterium]